ncbi:MAG: amidohydrolase family protein, partial [Candidatus Limnocylindria bacterium]
MTTAIRAGAVIDGTGGDPVRPAWVIIADGRIERIAGERPRDAEVIDASELTILPGLIDSHVHLGITTFNAQEKLLTPSSLVTAQALFNARATLEAGITTVRDGGGTPRGVRLAVDRGLFPGPRMRLSVGALSQTGGHGDQLMPMGVVMRLPVDAERPMAVVDGVDAVRRGTRELLRAGADQIKVLTSG